MKRIFGETLKFYFVKEINHAGHHRGLLGHSLALDFKYFARLPGRENIRLMPMLYPWQKYNSDFAGWEQLIRSFLDQGADAYGIWDGGGFKVQNIGKTMDGYKRPKPPASREIKLKSLQGFRIDRYHYFEVI